MNHKQSHFNRRTVLRTAAGLSVGGLAGCLNGSGETRAGTSIVNDDADDQGILRQVAVDGTELVVKLGSAADVDQLNLIQPNGELFGTRERAAGVRQVSFDIGTAYDPGEYRIIAVHGEEMVAETSVEIRPQLEIVAVGLFRNNPDKPWDEVYGESETDTKKNGEAFVTVMNAGSGPEAVIELRFVGDIPNPSMSPRGSGIHDSDNVVIPPGDEIDLFSSSFPFGAEIGDNGMGCSITSNNGRFKITLESRTTAQNVESEFNVQYSGSDVMHDCRIEITEA
ncbi:hypothetical protein [Haloferax denitrificans]|uniref:Secreted glycoprotein n=1 Tax=Haloferax denitrificans ATCC 35960 TaxID=662478 RepID=M0JGQ7_9EURY|nr:hypothetical protein [Haloferax denitrificans]EMA08312.1 hypothetical protein C438_00695 [Haloferax denitrificans ATCC 35960]